MIERTLRSTPAAATHCSIRSMAAAVGFSYTTIRGIWTAAFFAIGVLTYNLYVGFRSVALGKEWKRAQVQTVW